jgi:ABC-type multidrug transport system permease subunit
MKKTKQVRKRFSYQLFFYSKTVLKWMYVAKIVRNAFIGDNPQINSLIFSFPFKFVAIVLLICC